MMYELRCEFESRSACSPFCYSFDGLANAQSNWAILKREDRAAIVVYKHSHLTTASNPLSFEMFIQKQR